MPRSGKTEKIQVAADSIYKSPLVAKLINKVMRDGKKSLAQKIVYLAFANLKAQNQDPLATFEKALENITPRMEVRPRRVGGASYMVPMEVRGSRRQSLAITWLVSSARSRLTKDIPDKPKNKPLMVQKLTLELLDAAAGTGRAVAKREEMHRMAEANKAFSHFRW